MESKEEVISRVYYDQAGHGSMKKTYEHANNLNKSITEAHVKDWFYRNIQRKNDLAGYNSFIVTDYVASVLFPTHISFPTDVSSRCRTVNY